jgi:hypothetical protein
MRYLHPVVIAALLAGCGEESAPTQPASAKGTIGGDGFGDHTSLPLTIGFSLSAPADLVLGCQSEVSGLIFSQTSHITAIRVDRLTIQQPS